MPRIPKDAYILAKEKLIYDEASPSCLTWTHNGKAAGSADKGGYFVVRVNYQLLKAHRVIWFITNGELPEILDHKDGNPSNNKITNLRAATESQNRHNSRKHCDNKSGAKGVFFDKRTNKWVAECTINYKTHWGGRHVCYEDAVAASINLRQKLHKEFAKNA